MKIAALTMVYNEPVFVPIWRRYYGTAFGEENLFLLDHGSSDGSTGDIGRVNKTCLPRDTLDEMVRADLVSRFQADLLGRYDAVVFGDVDEIIVPDPHVYSGLSDYIERCSKPVVTTVGLDVQHVPGLESAIDLGRPVLSQRRFVQFDYRYSKPLVTKVPVRWTRGFHECNFPPERDRHLFLFHLKRMDFAMGLARADTQRAIVWSEAANKRGDGPNFRYEVEGFKRKFFPYTADKVAAMRPPEFDFVNRFPQSLFPIGPVCWLIHEKLAAIPERFRAVI